MRSVRNKISTLEATIRGVNRKIVELNTEKSSLEDRLRSLKSNLSRQDATKARNEGQISQADSLGTSITALQSQADTTSSDVRKAVLELQTLKTSLSEMTVALNNETEQLKAESSAI